MSLLEQLVARNNMLTERHIKSLDELSNSIRHPTGHLVPSPYDADFSIREIDIRTAHVDLEVTAIRPYNYLQVWCDGSLEGISLKVGDQSKTGINLNRLDAFPVPNVEKLYLTNDIRIGRQVLVMIFSRSGVTGLRYAGDTLSRAELAVRLGSIHSFDRRGEILFADDFENGLNAKWDVLGGVDPGSPTLSTTRCRSGSRAIKITTGPLGGGVGGIYHYEPYPRLTRFGLEMSFNLENNDVVAYMDMRVFDGTNLLQAQLLYDLPNTMWRYVNYAGVETPLVTGVTYQEGLSLFVTCKMVVDLSNARYHRIVIPNSEIDMSTIAAYVSASATVPHIEVHVSMNSTGAASVGYIDDVIITHNEP